jgi:hypothetical protein
VVYASELLNDVPLVPDDAASSGDLAMPAGASSVKDLDPAGDVTQDQ